MKLFWDYLAIYGQKAIFVLIALIFCYIGYRLIRRSLHYTIEKKLLPQLIAKKLQNALRYLFVLIAVLLLLQQAGVSIGSVWTFVTALLAMIAVGFVAVWSVISNALCTLLLILTKPFRIGDVIDIIDTSNPSNFISGRAMNINMLYTTLMQTAESGQQVTVLVPNNIFFQKYIRRRKGAETHELDEQLLIEESLLDYIFDRDKPDSGL